MVAAGVCVSSCWVFGGEKGRKEQSVDRPRALTWLGTATTTTRVSEGETKARRGRHKQAGAKGRCELEPLLPLDWACLASAESEQRSALAVHKESGKATDKNRIYDCAGAEDRLQYAMLVGKFCTGT